MNDHDIDAFVGCFTPGYRSEQPAHPDRTFAGRDQVRTNWSAIFREIPDVQGELVRSVSSEGEEWGEWTISGTRRDGSRMEMRGVIINGIREDRIAWARLYLMRTPDGNGRLELDKVHAPPAVTRERQDVPVNALGIRRSIVA